MNIKEAVESFINFRRSIGRKDESKTYTLRLFAKCMGETTEISSITENDCNAFLYRKGDVVTRYCLLYTSRCFKLSERQHPGKGTRQDPGKRTAERRVRPLCILRR